MSDLYADGCELRRLSDRAVLGTFSGHWPAVAAMIRLCVDPEFKSVCGDKPSDLAVEDGIRRALARDE